MEHGKDVTSWIRLSRKLSKSDRWLAEPFTRGQAWVDLLMLANWKAGHVRIRGVRVDLQRGQLAGSSIWLSHRWRWSRGKVLRFLNELENEHQIEQQITNITNVLTITNYDAYQKTDSKQDSKQDSKRTANDTADGQQTDTQEERIRTIEEGKESKEEVIVGSGQPTTLSSEITPEEFFQRWNAFAERTGLAKARKLKADRRTKIKTRLRDPEWWGGFLKACRKLPLKGSDWQPDLDWVIANASNIDRILEGKYDWLEKKSEANGKPKLTDAERRAASVATQADLAGGYDPYGT